MSAELDDPRRGTGLANEANASKSTVDRSVDLLEDANELEGMPQPLDDSSALHFGGGPLGLGLVTPTFVAAGTPMFLASGHANSVAPDRLSHLARTKHVVKVVVSSDMEPRPCWPLPIEEFVNTSTDHGLARVKDVISDSNVSLVTLAVRDGLSTLAPIIMEGIRHRNSAASLTIVSCENTQPANWGIFKSACREPVVLTWLRVSRTGSACFPLTSRRLVIPDVMFTLRTTGGG